MSFKIFIPKASPQHFWTTRQLSAQYQMKSVNSMSQLGKRSFSTSLALDPTVGLTPDQIEIYELARNYSEKELLPHAATWDEQEIFPKQTLKELAALGMGAIYANKEYGGTGLGRLEAAVIFEALSQGCVSTTAYLSIHNMCVRMVDEFGTPELKASFLPSLASMESFASYCLTEPGSGSDAAGLITSAKKVGNHWLLNGEKAFISGGGESDLYLVMARTAEHKYKGITCFLVEKGTPGLKFGKKEKKLGWNSQPTRAVIFEDCQVPLSHVVGEIGQGFSIAMKALDGGRVNIAACSLGAAHKCIVLASEHVSVRKQFGTPLRDFQNTQFKIAQMATNLVASRQMVRLAAQKLDQNAPDKTTFCAMAKLFATENCFNICNSALQLFGGYGYLKDYPIQRYLRDLRVHQILEGTNEVMQMIIARDILGLK